MSNLNKIIDIEFLKDRAACIEGIAYFEEEIKEPIAARELINRLLAADDGGKIWWVNWLLCRLFTRPQYIQYAIFSAEQVLPIFEQEYPDDKRPRKAIEAAGQVALSDTEENRKIAANAAADAAYATYAAAYAARAAADAADAANSANSAGAADAADNSFHLAAWAAAKAAVGAAYVAAGSTYADCAAEAAYAANTAANSANAAAHAANAAADAAYATYAAAYAAGGNEMLLKIIRFGIELLNQAA